MVAYLLEPMLKKNNYNVEVISVSNYKIIDDLIYDHTFS